MTFSHVDIFWVQINGITRIEYHGREYRPVGLSIKWRARRPTYNLFLNPELLKDSLIRYYIGVAESDKEIIKNIKKFSKSDFAKGSGFRLSLKVNYAIFECFEHIRVKTSLNKTQILKGIILQINEDILQKPLKKRLNELQRVLLAAA
jgi:hypothetical protein